MKNGDYEHNDHPGSLLAMCVGCGQSSEQKEESVPTDVTKAEKQEQVQVEAEDEIRWKMESRYLG